MIFQQIILILFKFGIRLWKEYYYYHYYHHHYQWNPFQRLFFSAGFNFSKKIYIFLNKKFPPFFKNKNFFFVVAATISLFEFSIDIDRNRSLRKWIWSYSNRFFVKSKTKSEIKKQNGGKFINVLRKSVRKIKNGKRGGSRGGGGKRKNLWRSLKRKKKFFW